MGAFRRRTRGRGRRDALQRLRLRIILVAMASIFGALLVIFGVVNVLNYRNSVQRIDFFIDTIYEHGGSFPPRPQMDGPYQITVETPFETRYFVVEFDADRRELGIDLDHIAAVDQQAAESAASDILASGRDQGYWDDFRYRVFEDEDGGGMLVVVDCFQMIQSSRALAGISLAVIGACMVVAFALIVPCSKRILRPYFRNLERQKRFVTDASHELKTPVAIITANTDLMEAIDGETQWTQSTKKQVARLTELISDLIELARADEPGADESFTDVDLGAVVGRAVEDFAPLAEASGKTLFCPTSSSATVRGDAASLERLVSVLLDNAIKHGDEGSRVEVALSTGRRDVQLTVTNSAASLGAQETEHLFDRFYRPDESRERSTGGYGIGLSIARSIVERHGGEISARKVGADLQVRVALPSA